MSRMEVTCMQCGVAVVADDRFCEGCGAILCAVGRCAVPGPADFPPGPCADCGNDSYADDYCTVCGQRVAEPDRAQATLGDIVLITDRGRAHARNEDAAAAGIVDAVGTAVAICDGVSTSAESHTAAISASLAGVEAMLRALAASRRARSAVLAGLTDAAAAAAGVGPESADPTLQPSCTYAAAVVVPRGPGAEITIGSVGDSRVYWLSEPPGTAECLTVDDSLAQELVTAGVPVESRAVRAGAHTLTRWLGGDADPRPWSPSSVRTITTTDRGTLMLCTDGLWNYLPDADDLARVCAGKDATTAAVALVEHALNAGGRDNITVAIIPIGGPR